METSSPAASSKADVPTFGAKGARVVDLDAPRRTRTGYEILVEFDRETYEATLALQFSVAPEMISIVEEALYFFKSDKLRWHDDADAPVRQWLARARAALKQARGE
jgi:hypothetical protein